MYKDSAHRSSSRRAARVDAGTTRRMYSKQKLDAIYELRTAVEERTRLEIAVDREPTPSRRDALLKATLKVEDQTQTAIEACHYCGRAHLPDEPHASLRDNVIDVDFRPRDQSEPEG